MNDGRLEKRGAGKQALRGDRNAFESGAGIGGEAVKVKQGEAR